MTTWHPVSISRHTFTADHDGHIVTRTLDAIMGLDCPPVRVAADGTVTELRDAPTPPDVIEDELCDQRWELMTGYSGQHGYNGPTMHASESIGGRLADDILSTPGIYAAVVVGEDADGWAIVRIVEA